MCIYVSEVGGLVRPCGSPSDREIDFDFVSCSCRACERAGEAKLCGRERCASLTLGLGGENFASPRGPFWAYFYAQVRGFFEILDVFVRRAGLILGNFCAQVRGFVARQNVFETQFGAQAHGFLFSVCLFLCTGVCGFFEILHP